MVHQRSWPGPRAYCCRCAPALAGVLREALAAHRGPGRLVVDHRGRNCDGIVVAVLRVPTAPRPYRPAQLAPEPCGGSSSANLAFIVSLPRVSFLTVRAVALSLARRRLFSGAEQSVLHLLQAINGFVDLSDRGIELALGEVVVPAECRLEAFEFGLEVGDVDGLLLRLLKLGLDRDGLLAALRSSAMMARKNCGRTTNIFRVLV